MNSQSTQNTSLPSAPLRGRALPFAQAIDIWRDFETHGCLTPYQTWRWLSAWNDAVLARRGEKILALIIENLSGEAVMALPVTISRKCGLNIARVPGDDHANFKFPLLKTAEYTIDDIYNSFLTCLNCANIDALLMENMPLHWEGTENPLAARLTQKGPTPGLKTSLEASKHTQDHAPLNSGSRKKLRQKQRGLERIAPTSFFLASSPDEIKEVIDTFFEQKSARFLEMGVPNIFTEAGVMDFIRTAACPSPSNAVPALQLYALRSGSRIIATYGGSAHGSRFSAAINSITLDDLRRFSPGDLLLSHVIEDCRGKGYKTFDMGLGDFSYKASFCPDLEIVYDGIIGITSGGSAYGKAWLSSRAIKRRLKKLPFIMKIIYRLRSNIRAT